MHKEETYAYERAHQQLQLTAGAWAVIAMQVPRACTYTHRHGAISLYIAIMPTHAYHLLASKLTSLSSLACNHAYTIL